MKTTNKYLTLILLVLTIFLSLTNASNRLLPAKENPQKHQAREQFYSGIPTQLARSLGDCYLNLGKIQYYIQEVSPTLKSINSQLSNTIRTHCTTKDQPEICKEKILALTKNRKDKTATKLLSLVESCEDVDLRNLHFLANDMLHSDESLFVTKQYKLSRIPIGLKKDAKNSTFTKLKRKLKAVKNSLERLFFSKTSHIHQVNFFGKKFPISDDAVLVEPACFTEGEGD